MGSPALNACANAAVHHLRLTTVLNISVVSTAILSVGIVSRSTDLRCRQVGSITRSETLSTASARSKDLMSHPCANMCSIAESARHSAASVATSE